MIRFRGREFKFKLFTYIPREVKKQYVFGIIVFLIVFSFVPKPLYVFESGPFGEWERFAYLYDVFLIILAGIIYKIGYTIAYYRQENKYNNIDKKGD